MPLSRQWTADTFHAEAVKDLPPGSLTNFPRYDRFDAIHRFVGGVGSLFYGLYVNRYMRSKQISPVSGTSSIDQLLLMPGYEHRVTVEADISTAPHVETHSEVGGFQPMSAGSNNVAFANPVSTTDYVVIARCFTPSAIIGFNRALVKSLTGFTITDVDEACTLEYFIHELGPTTPADIVSIAAGTHAVVFPVALTSANFVLLMNCYTAGGAEVFPTITGRTATGFMIEVSDPVTLEYYAVDLAGTYPNGLIRNAGRVTVGALATEAVVLSTAADSDDYALLMPQLYTASAVLGYNITLKTTTGFSVTNLDPVFSGTFDYVTVDATQSSPVAASTEVIPFDAVSYEAIRGFRSSAFQNRKRGVFALTGEELFTRWGYGITSLASLIIRYPGIPLKAEAVGTYLDIPDGEPVNIALAGYRDMLMRRIVGKGNGYLDEAVRSAQMLYQSIGVEAPKTEELKAKIGALQ